ncbi:DNA-binding protein [Polaromonas sp.]|uniref:DNA-binding protein n=1 Tax=Polaromonas sp. TaxID=1869339 RepID=UPI00352B7992
MSNGAAISSKTPLASFEAVKAAADALADQGVIPSVRAVTRHLGGGSPNTITTHLRRWREELPAVEARKTIVLDERIHSLLAEQIQTAVAEATKQAVAERDARTEDLADVSQRSTEQERELEANATRIAELEETVQRQTGRLEALTSEIEHVKADAASQVQSAQAGAAEAVAAAQAEAAGERAKLDEMARRLGTAEEKAAEADRLRKALADMTAARDAQSTARVDAEKALAVAEAREKETVGQVGVLTKRAGVLDGQLEELRSKLGSAEVKAASAQAQAEERALQIADLRAQISATDAKKSPTDPRS